MMTSSSASCMCHRIRWPTVAGRQMYVDIRTIGALRELRLKDEASDGVKVQLPVSKWLAFQPSCFCDSRSSSQATLGHISTKTHNSCKAVYLGQILSLSTFRSNIISEKQGQDEIFINLSGLHGRRMWYNKVKLRLSCRKTHLFHTVIGVMHNFHEPPQNYCHSLMKTRLKAFSQSWVWDEKFRLYTVCNFTACNFCIKMLQKVDNFEQNNN